MTLAVALLGAVAIACSEDSSTAPTPGGINAAKHAAGGGGSTSVTVTATDPSYGDQGTINLDVQVTGSGFDPSAQAQWIESGDTVPSTKVKVNHTTFVSSTKVVANIDIAQDAPIDDYNVAVALSTGKKGIGNELFTVTQAQPLGFDGSGRGINDLGQIVGTAKAGAFFWDPAAPEAPQIIGQASAVGIDQAGVTISGYDGSHGLVWTRAPGGQWPRTPTPLPAPYTSVAREMGSDPVTGQGKYIAGEACTAASKRGCTTTSPARWVRDLTTGSWTLQLLQPHPDYAGYVVRTISANGQVGGWTIGSTANVGVVWEDAVTPPIILLPLPGDGNAQVRGINPTGTIAVGWSHGAVGRPVYWKRNPSTGAWDQNPINLNASPCSANGQAEAASRDGIIIGTDCGLVVAWRLTDTGVQELPVGGLGPGIHADGSANVQSGISPYASGHLSNGNAVRWRLAFP